MHCNQNCAVVRSIARRSKSSCSSLTTHIRRYLSQYLNVVTMSPFLTIMFLSHSHIIVPLTTLSIHSVYIYTWPPTSQSTLLRSELITSDEAVFKVEIMDVGCLACRNIRIKTCSNMSEVREMLNQIA